MAKDLNKANALTALLDSNTITEAAEKAGISRRTMYSYIRNDVEFARAFQTAREKMFIDTIDDIQETRKRASDVILEIMEDKEQPAPVRLQAAKLVMSDTDAKEARADALASRNVERNKDMFSFTVD